MENSNTQNKQNALVKLTLTLEEFTNKYLTPTKMETT
jgi:hypothetical protein